MSVQSTCCTDLTQLKINLIIVAFVASQLSFAKPTFGGAARVWPLFSAMCGGHRTA